jgi:hypothetical protein
VLGDGLSLPDHDLGKRKPIREAYADRRDRERCRVREKKKRRPASSLTTTYFFFLDDFFDFFFAGISGSPPPGHALTVI